MSEPPAYRDEEPTITVADGTRGFILRTPAQLAPRPLLLIHLANEQQLSMNEVPYSLVPNDFLRAGHRVACFDLPSHGKRQDHYGAGLVGWAAAMASGVDVFADVVEVARKVIDYCLERRLAEPQRIAVSGISRGGLCALHLLARDHRIAAAAVFAPITHLPALHEFASLTASPIAQQGNAMSLVPALAGRALFIAISVADPRVGTEHCLAFHNALSLGDEDRVVLYLTSGTTHGLSDETRLLGAAWLLDNVAQMSISEETRET